MKKHLLLCYGLLVFNVIGFSQNQFDLFINNYESYWNSDPTLKTTSGSGYKPYLRNKSRIEKLYDATGSIKGYCNAIQNYSNQIKNTTDIQNYGNWNYLGPFNIPPNGENQYQSGKGWIWSLAVDPNNYNHIYAGAHHGGVWVTSDGGANWIPLTDNIPEISGVISIAVNWNGGLGGNDIVYIASTTADEDLWGYSTGVFKSIDSGNSWQNINTGDLINVFPADYQHNIARKIIIHPNNPDMLYLITYDNAFKTTDGGISWQRMPVTGTTEASFRWWDRNNSQMQACVDQYNPGNSTCVTNNIGSGNSTGLTNVINNCCGGNTDCIECIKLLPHNEFGFYDIEISIDNTGNETLIISGHKIYTSNDNGNIWQDITALITHTVGLTDNVFGGDLLQVERCETAVDNQSYPGKVFFFFNGNGKHLVKFEDGIPTFLKTVYLAGADKNKIGCIISPTLVSGGEPIIYLSGLQVYKYNKGTNSENSISTSGQSGSLNGPGYWVHDDIRYLTVVNENGVDKLFIGHDGGLSFGTYSSGACSPYYCWNNICGGTNGLHANEFFGLAGVESNPDLIIGGLQDAGVMVYNKNSTNQWIHSSAGDGSKALAIDYNDPNYMYQTDYFNIRIGRSTNMGLSFLATNNTYSLFTKPNSNMTLHPTDSNKLLVGGSSHLYRFNNVKTSWSNNIIDPTNYGGQEITGICYSKSNPNIIYIACSKMYLWDGATLPQNYSGCIWKTSNGDDTSPTWTDISANLIGLHYGWITDIEVNPNNSDEIWVSFALAINHPRIYHSTDGGTTWETYSNGLPASIPYNEIKLDEYNNILYAASDVGIFYKDITNDDNWLSFNNGLPQKFIYDLEINYCAGKIRAATFGRGIWESPLILKDINVTSSTTWNTDTKVLSDLYVKSGGTLTITSTVEFSENKKIIIERGAKLILDGGKLTSNTACGNNTWQGIQVQGNSTLAQTDANQGVLEMKNGATIENAITAIKAESGAIVRAENCTLRNNVTGIQFEPYNNTNYSYIKNSRFETIAILNNNQVPDCFVKLNGVKGIKLEGNTFVNSNYSAYNYDKRGQGILSTGSKFTVDDYTLLCITKNKC